MGDSNQDINVITYIRGDGTHAITTVTSEQLAALTKAGRLVKTHKIDK